jgi:hypothetical protein
MTPIGIKIVSLMDHNRFYYNFVLYVCDFIRVCILYVDISYTLVTHTNKTDHQAMTDIISNYG